MSNYDDASLIMFPSGYKEDKIYSLKPTDGSGDLTFTRASTATRVNADGLIETSPVNLVQYSEEFNASPWALDTGGGTGSITITNNYGTAPNGTTTADRIQMVKGTAYAQTFQPLNVISGAQYTLSVYLKSLSGTPTISTIVGADVSSKKTLTTEWVKYELNFNSTSATIYPLIALYEGDSATADILAWGYQVNIGSTAKTYFPTTDRLNVPRIDYTGGGCGKLLLESQRTNLALYSEQFDNAIWTKSNVTISANNTTSPDGTQNADLIYPTLSSSNLGVYQNTTGVTGVVGTVSCYVKSAGKNWALLGTDNGSSYNVSFDLVNGVVGSVPTGYTATIESVGNGWYRITATFQSGYSQAYPFVGVADNTNRSVTADGTNGLYIWGFQTEIASYVSSYIPTLASSVTRLADAASKTGISSLIGETEGTMFVEILFTGAADNNPAYIQTWESQSERMGLFYSNSANLIRPYLVSSGQSDFTLGFTPTAGTRYKMAFCYKANDYAFFVNGSQVTIDAKAAVPTAGTKLFVGCLDSATQPNRQFSNINQALLFKTRLTNDQLADLTGGNKTTFNDLATLYGYQIL